MASRTSSGGPRRSRRAHVACSDVFVYFKHADKGKGSRVREKAHRQAACLIGGHEKEMSMSFALMFLVALVLIAVVFGGLLIGAFNKLVTYRNRYKNAFAQIEVQLKRRYDLIPNLVETAKGYMSHERETLEAVISARNQASAGL